MELVLHKAIDRGAGNPEIDWLDTKYSFSFANYHNPLMMGFGALRVINDDTIAQGRGFDLHEHEDMEIITIILEGTLEHKDSTGNSKTLKPGDVQHMSAGRGILHSEYNASKKKPVSFLQIWINPARLGITPSYNQRTFTYVENVLTPLVAPEVKGTLNIAQRAYISRVIGTKQVTYTVKDANNGVYIFVISGSITISNTSAKSRDAIGVSGATQIKIVPSEKSDILLIEVPLEDA